MYMLQTVVARVVVNSENNMKLLCAVNVTDSENTIKVLRAILQIVKIRLRFCAQCYT